MLKRIFAITFTAAVFACTSSPQAQKPVAGVTNITPDEQQALVVKEVVGLIENYNYKKIKINDSISSIVFDRYIKSLDPSKYYFLESDIKEFEENRYKLDDAFRIGDLSVPFYIFNVYLKRYNDRIDQSLKEIKAKYDFTKNESIVLDREKVPFAKNANELNSLWQQRIKYELVNLRAAGSDGAKSVETLSKRYASLKLQASKFNNQDVFQIVMDAFTEAVDPHTNYFNPRNAETFNQEMSRSLEGIGATLQIDNEVVKIVSLVAGGPAFKSKKVNAGDKIVAVAQGDGEFEDIIGWRIDNAVAKIKGPKGTTVRLKIIPAGQDLSTKPVIVTLVREKIILADQSAKKIVKSIMSEGKAFKIGIIKIPAFYADFKAANAGDPNYKSTTRDVRLLIDTLKNMDKVDALLIDLRANGGGSLTEAIDLTGLFIEKGPVVQVKDYRNKVTIHKDENAGIAWDGPLGVMVDRLSASASEIFAGAIQDYQRGIVMGTQSFGKGTVQSSIDLNQMMNSSIMQQLAAIFKKKEESKNSSATTKDNNVKTVTIVDKNGVPLLGQINLTMAKFYRVSGNSTQHKGVIPDITFPSIYPMDKIGEDTEPSALPFDMVNPTSFNAVYNLSAVKAELIKLHNKRMATSVDYKILNEDIADNKKAEKEKAVTLNEAKLKAERDAAEVAALNKVNQLRAAKGLAPLKKGEKNSKEDASDFIEDESAQIMVDFMKLFDSNKAGNKLSQTVVN